jgi:hypothetical protein
MSRIRKVSYHKSLDTTIFPGTSDSIILQKFVKNNLAEVSRCIVDSRKHDDDNDSLVSNMMCAILRIIRNGNILYKSQRHHNDIIETDFVVSPDSPRASLGKNYSFIHPDIRSIIESSPISGISYNYRTNVRDITIHVLFLSSMGISERAEANNIAERAITWLNVADSISNRCCMKSINVYIILSELPKLLPSEIDGDNDIGCIHVNSGLTTSCPEHGEIHVYRREEWLKVLVHETMHAFGLDFSMENNTTISNNSIKSTFPINKDDLRLYETYCETWAEIINIILYTFFSSVPGVSDKAMQDSISIRLLQEISWSLFQCSKIMRFYDLRYDYLFSRSACKTKARNANYKERDTHLFSYYVAKALVMFHINEFFQWCIDSNTNIIKFSSNRDTIEGFSEFIGVHHASPAFIACSKQTDAIIDSAECGSDFVFTSMCMSLFDLDNKVSLSKIA